MTAPPLRAVLWDFDGTLVDTRARNMSVNRRIIREITGRSWQDFPVLRSQVIYDVAQRAAINWREFYRGNCGFSDDQIDRAGDCWAPYQIEDPTPVPLVEGVEGALERLNGLPKGIVSQNARETIESVLSAHGLGHRFDCIVGYAEVAMARQKPAPDCLLLGLEKLTGLAPGLALYIGDHATDICCVDNANHELAGRGLELQVESVAALWGPGAVDDGWADGADHRAATPHDVVEIVERLLPARI
jgi:phosphoglycolate phosphatase-like HAD superfamily hydrolase